MDIRLSNSQTLTFTKSFFRPFTFTVDTTLTGTGTTNADQYELMLTTGVPYNFDVDWGDGSNDIITSYNQTEILHTYSSSGIYTISITGIIPRFYSANAKDEMKLLTIPTFGDVKFETLYLYNCVNFTGGWTDTPKSDTKAIMAFQNCPTFNEPLNDLNIKCFYQLGGLIRQCTTFNQPIDNIDFSEVVDFRYAFYNSSAFNQPINDLNLIWPNSGADFDRVFRGANAFNQPLDNWDVSGFDNFREVFLGATAFNQDINGWDVGLGIDFYRCFGSATSFNLDLSSWNLGNATTMEGMFNSATSFNQDVGAWDVSSCTNMADMFNATAMTQANYDALLIGWTGWSGGVATKTVQSSVPFGIGTVPYTLGGDAQAAHDWLTGTKLWTITDGGGI